MLTVTGRGDHAAVPHEAIDPIVIAAQIILALQTLISREISPFHPSVITIGEIQAGTASNIIPETAVMCGTLRTFSNTHRAYLLRWIGKVAHGITSTLGGSCKIELPLGCSSCSNDPAITALVRQIAESVVGKQMLEENQELLGGGSDNITELIQIVPGCYFMVGSAIRLREPTTSIITPISTWMKMLCPSALRCSYAQPWPIWNKHNRSEEESQTHWFFVH